MKIIKIIIVLPLLTILGCAQYVYNKGMVRTQIVDCNGQPKNTASLVTVKTTPWYYIIDANSRGYCTNFNDKISFIPLGADSGDLLAQVSGPLSSLTSKMVIPIVP